MINWDDPEELSPRRLSVAHEPTPLGDGHALTPGPHPLTVVSRNDAPAAPGTEVRDIAGCALGCVYAVACTLMVAGLGFLAGWAVFG